MAHAEIDVESGHIMEAAGLWAFVQSKDQEQDFESIVQQQMRSDQIFVRIGSFMNRIWIFPI